MIYFGIVPGEVEPGPEALIPGQWGSSLVPRSLCGSQGDFREERDEDPGEIIKISADGESPAPREERAPPGGFEGHPLAKVA